MRQFTKYPKTPIKASTGPSRYVVRVYRADEDVGFDDYGPAKQYATSEYDKMGVSRVQILDRYNDDNLLAEWVNEPEEVE